MKTIYQLIETKPRKSPDLATLWASWRESHKENEEYKVANGVYRVPEWSGNYLKHEEIEQSKKEGYE